MKHQLGHSAGSLEVDADAGCQSGKQSKEFAIWCKSNAQPSGGRASQVKQVQAKLAQGEDKPTSETLPCLFLGSRFANQPVACFAFSASL